MSCPIEVGDVCHQKYPSCFFFSIDADWSWSMTRPWRSELVREQHFLDDRRQRVGVALDRPGKRVAAERAESHFPQHRLLARVQRHAIVVHHDQRTVALHHRALGREVQRHDRDVVQVDVLPDVELGPVRHRKHADRLTLVHARVVYAPELGSLVLRVPAMLRRAEREDPLLGAALLLVAARTAKGGIEAVEVERLLQGLGLHHVGMDRRAVREWVYAFFYAVRVGVRNQLETVLVHHALAERVHLPELPARVDVQQRERRLGRVERLHRHVQHRGAVLADGVQHHRLAALRDHLAHDLDCLGLEALEVRERARWQVFRLGAGHGILTTVRPVTRPWM